MKKTRRDTQWQININKLSSSAVSFFRADFWDKTKETSFELAIESEVTYYAVDKMLSEKIQAIAQKRGVTADTLINLWVQEKLQEQKAS